MKRFMFGCVLFIGGLLSLLLFPITLTQGPWEINLDILSLSIFMFILMILLGFTLCIYEAYIKK